MGRVNPSSHFPDPCTSPFFLEWLLDGGHFVRPSVERREKKASSWLHIAALALTSCVTLGKLLNLSEPRFPGV